METIVAYCWRSGLIEFGQSCPKGALPLAEGEKEEIESAVSALATHSYNDEYLIPKSMEWVQALMDNDQAAADKAAMDSLVYLKSRLDKTLEKGTFKRQGRSHEQENYDADRTRTRVLPEQD